MKNILRNKRTEAGLSQTELALASGVPRYAICLAENAIRLPDREQQALLAETLNVKISLLFPTRNRDKEPNHGKG